MRSVLVAACAASVAMLAGCSFGSDADRSSLTQSTQSSLSSRSRARGPVSFHSTPRWVQDACGGLAAGMRRFCPTTIPARASRDLTLSLFVASRRDPFSLMQLQSGNESLGDQHRNRPPHLVGMLLVSGDVEQALAGLLPGSGAPTGVHVGLANAPRTTGLSLGARRWAGLKGELSLAPSEGRIPLAYFRYVFFRWHDARGVHAVGLRDWEPFDESVRALHSVVEGLRPARKTSLAYPPQTVVPGGVAMARPPRWLTAACRSLRTRPICPGRIPAAEPTSIDIFYEPDVQAGSSATARQDWISVEWGVPYGNQAARNKPPRFVHLDLRAGAVPVDRRFSHPIVRPRNGLMRNRTNGEAGAGPIPLGRRRWGGRRGMLVLGDCFGNHLCYRWREHGVGYQIDLHGWEPFLQTVAALRAIVASRSS